MIISRRFLHSQADGNEEEMANIAAVRRRISNCNTARGRFRLIAAAAMMLAPAAAGTAQSTPPTAPSATVELRIQLSWWGASSRSGPRRTTMALQPLDSHEAAGTVQVSEDATTVIKLTRGRYQLTTINPIVVNGQAYGWSIELPLIESTNELRLSQENAVRLSSAGIANARNISSGSSGPAPPPAATADDETRAQIAALLRRWTSSLKSHNLKAQMSCYAPRLATYFRQHNVSREWVQQDKQSLLQRYPKIRQLDLSDVQITTNASQPEATAVKTWSFGGGETDWHGQAITYFVFQKVGSRWAISSEREQLAVQNEPVTEGSAAITPGPK